jgi:uncharacterized protein
MRKRTNTARKLAKRDCERMNRATLQWLSNCLTPWLVRYNAVLEQAWLKTELGVDLAGDKLQQIRKMDDLSNLSDLADLGRRAAAAQVKPEHLPAAFDLAKPAT